MALEDLTGSSKYISHLNNANPTGADNKSQGDDHIRGVKNVLLNSFPNVTGAVTATHTLLNSILPAGTIMIFYQPAVPTGWTQVTTKQDYMLRTVSGVGSGNGGSDSPILNDKIPTHNHTASSNSTGAHTHTINHGSTDNGTLGFRRSQSNLGTVNSGSSGSHSHTITVNNNSGSNWTPKYIDVVIGIKD